MKIRDLIIVLGFFCNISIASEPNPAATKIISELGLRETKTPVSENPGWAPKKVLVSLAPQMEGQGDFKQAVMDIAGENVQVVFNNGFSIPADMLVDVDAILGWCTPQTLQNAGDSLLWLHSYSVGIDRCANLDNKFIEQRLFTNNQRLSGPGIAEHSIAMMMALARNLPSSFKAQHENTWDRATLTSKPDFGELPGKTLLIAGLGGIGTQVAKRAHGLGMRVIATRNSSRSGPDYVDYVGLADELNTLAAEADVVVNALPLTNKTQGIFNRAFFDAIKPGALFISVGRGASTVTEDLIFALESGKLYGAGLDVTDPEPLPAESELWQMDNVIITPHISGFGRDNIYRSAVIALENLRRYIAGETLLNPVNMSEGY